MSDCPFCDIRSKTMSGEVYTFGHGPLMKLGGGFLAFPPLNPATDGHMLVIPTRHVADFLELGIDETAEFMAVVRECAGHLRMKYKPDGMNLITSAGAAASQTVMHLHVHLVPRYLDEDRHRFVECKSPTCQEEGKHCANVLCRRPPDDSAHKRFDRLGDIWAAAR
jgi:histidine triad (HIT) family protein